MRHPIGFISLLFLFVFAGQEALATHNRSGEITYAYLGNNTYKIRVTTYTNNGSSSLAADRCFQTIFIDNLLDSIVLPRINGLSVQCSNAQQGSAHDGVDITPPGTASGGYRLNIYETTYTFQGNSMHILYMFDPNRNAGSLNIPNSVNVPFALVDTIFTSNQPGLNFNNSPVLTFPPIDQACAGQVFIHNPGAYDPDQDSLSYALTTCLGIDGLPIPGYTPPASLNVTIDNTGNLIWNVPQIIGEYNFAILITEWRKDKDGIYHILGRTLRDLQVNVQPCQNNPPNLVNIKDTCIIAGTNYTQLVTASDPNNDQITLTANGGPFNMNPAALFSTTPAVGNVSGLFSWTPSCGQISSQPYLVTIKAQDNSSPVSLVDFESFYIRVVAPPPQNVTATASGASIILNWQAPSACASSGSGNQIVNYLIYRKNECTPYLPDPCATGVDITAGYTLIGSHATINNPLLVFTDNNNGLGLGQGIDYSYLIVAQFADGSLSGASAQVCQHLVRDVPVIINVSVDTTDVTAGEIWIRWQKPVVSAPGAPSLDTLANPGPYEFRLMQHNGFTGTFTQVYNISKPYFASINSLADTTFTSKNLNTQNFPYTYKIDFYCNNNLKGSTQTASSVFLTATGLARKVKLNWQVQVPWINTKSYIYRQLSTGAYALIDSTLNTQYIDTGRVNGVTYCYKIKTVGGYSDPTIYKPLINWSQKTCAVPADTEPPCAPGITDIAGNCTTQVTTLSWNNPNNSCSDDAVSYNLYYTPVLDSPLVKINTFPINITSYQTDYSSSIAGCYAITAVDSFGNESVFSQKVCVDNCPEFELPNIITTNGDNINDYFYAIKNKYIKAIDLKIYDRWGLLVYETKKPDFFWNGKNKLSLMPCTDGTYYYICEVQMIRYTGIETKVLKGFLQIVK